MRKLPPPQQPLLTSSSELPTYTIVGQQPHDAAPEAPKGSFPASRQEILWASSQASPWPQRKNYGHPSAFAIGPTAVEEKPKADCRTRKGNQQRTQALQRPLFLFTKTRTWFRNFLEISTPVDVLQAGTHS